MRWAVYDLGYAPPSFDFVTFLVLARYHGADGVLFIPGVCSRKLSQYDHAEQAERVRTIVFPACDLYRMEKKLVSEAESHNHDVAWPPYYNARGMKSINSYLMGWLKSVRKPEALMPTKSGLERATARLKGKTIVCHMRVTKYQQVRNSGPDWPKWASDHGAYLLEDAEISLDERAGLMELAALNIGVNAGPMALCELSVHRPYITMKRVCGVVATSLDFYAQQGWFPGDRFPWAGKHQMQVWDDRDDYEAIESAYQKWLTDNREQESHEVFPFRKMEA